MAFRRRKKRSLSRQHIKRKRWDMKRRRAPMLRFKQLFAGKFLYVLASLLLVSGAIYTAFFTSVFTVATVRVETEYKDINVEAVQESIAGLVQGENALLLQLLQVEDAIYNQFPDVSSLQCRRQFFHQEVLCQAIGYELVAVIKHQNNKYYINENGVVIAFDNRKLGLPIFDLILNPVYAGLENNQTIGPQLPDEDLSPPVTPSSLGASVIEDRVDGNNTFDAVASAEDQATLQALEEEGTNTRITFLQPFDAPPIEPVIRQNESDVFDIRVGQKILDPEELKTILDAIHELEGVLKRKVIQAQYVQVAGELSLTSLPQVRAPEESSESSDEDSDTEEPFIADEASDHDFTILLDLRRNLEDQYNKLKKTKEVIDFSQVEQVDLSIDGEKVFYR